MDSRHKTFRTYRPEECRVSAIGAALLGRGISPAKHHPDKPLPNDSSLHEKPQEGVEVPQRVCLHCLQQPTCNGTGMVFRRHYNISKRQTSTKKTNLLLYFALFYIKIAKPFVTSQENNVILQSTKYTNKDKQKR